MRDRPSAAAQPIPTALVMAAPNTKGASIRDFDYAQPPITVG